MTHRLLLGSAVASLTLVLAGCGLAGDSPTSTEPAVTPDVVDIADMSEPYVRDPDLTGFSEDNSWGFRQAALRSGDCHIGSAETAADFDADRCASARDDRPSYLVIGDSYAGDAFMILSRAYPETHFGQVSVPGCKLMLPQRFAAGDDSKCATLYTDAFETYAASGTWDGIVIASDWEEGHYYRIDDAVSFATEANVELIMFGPRQTFTSSVSSLVETGDVESTVSPDASVLTAGVAETNDTLKTRFSDTLTYVDMVSLQCAETCTVVADNGTPIYLDERHVSVTGAERLADALQTQRPSL